MLVATLAAMAFGSETASVSVNPRFLEGVHFACEAAFDVVVEDTAYFQGQSVAVSGSFSFYNWPDRSRVFVGMKLGILGGFNEAWRAPSNAYVVNGYKTNLSEQQAQSEADLPGFRLFVYDFSGEQTMMAIARLAAEGRMNVAYTIDGGSMPTTFPIQLTDEMSGEWGECVRALVGRDAEPAV